MTRLYATGGNGPITRPHSTGGNHRPGRYTAEPDVASAFSGAYDPGPIEAQLRHLYRELVTAAGGRSWHTYDSRRSDEGWPDESTIIRDRLFFVELKAPGKKATDAQRETISLLNGCRGVQAFLVTSSGDRGRDLLLLEELLRRATQ